MNFDKAFEGIIAEEGVYSNDPRDPGGATKFGITWRTLESAVAAGIVPACRIEDLTIDGAKAIYRALYWSKVHGDELPWPLSLFVFDAAVNQGNEPAKKMLQKTLNTVQDGIIGKNTLAAIAKANQPELCALYMAERVLRYTGTQNFDVYGRGWMKRLFKIAMEGAAP